MATPSTAPATADDAAQRFFARYAETVGGASWAAVQRFLGSAEPKPASIEEWITVADQVRLAPPTLGRIAHRLAAPFALSQIQMLPGATTKDNARALAMPYADLRAYEYRLDEVAGPAHWGTAYEMTGRGVVCALTICGVTKSGIGDYPTDPKDENAATSAQAQAFKRACSAFGIGRYLYDLPKAWCDYDSAKKQIINPDKVAWELYKEAGLLRDDERMPQAPARGASGR